mmetsp:Transcript_66587/g.150353  ORF Transcript_66587/g.150353 Transcript_66587/m.150353 type:complete len:263 (-) Transcript_66587:477-1265(-)
MKARALSSTVRLGTPQMQHTASSAVKAARVLILPPVESSAGQYLNSMNLEIPPCSCCARCEACPAAAAPPPWAASASCCSRGLQQGVARQEPMQQFEQHGQQSACFFCCRSSSRATAAEKSVTWRTKSRKMLKAAYMQKELRAGRALDTEMAKATKSVSEVTVIDVAAWANASRIRSGMGCVRSVWSKAFTMTNESSTPSPRMTKGRTECTGVQMKPMAAQRPKEPPMESRMESTEASERRTRDPGLGQTQRHGRVPRFTER